MPLIYLVHEDEKLLQALQATLKVAWPGLQCRIGPAAPEDAVQFNPAATPLPFKAMVQQIQHLLREHYWPAFLDLEQASLDTRNREWQSGEETVLLTEKEVGVLVYLWQRKAPASREDLLRDVWEYASDADTHTIETHIYRLRQKIESDPGQPQFLVTTKDGYQLAMKARV